MALFRFATPFKGGVHPPDHKGLACDKAIEPLPLPKRLYIPLQQHIGSPAEPVVEVGQQVFKGQLLAAASGPVSAPVHAPSSGTISAIDDCTAPHPSGLPVRSIILETDGPDHLGDRRENQVVPIDPFALAPEEIARRVAEAGIVGMGGAAFPSAVKLGLGSKRQVRTLIINGGECEPYLTCDDRLMQERSQQIIDGVRIMLHALGEAHAVIAIEDNKPAAAAVLRQAAADFERIELLQVPTRYPMGSEKQLIQVVTGREVPAGARSADIGIIVHNVATAYAVHEAVRLGRPLTSRIVTVSGGAVNRPANLEVPIGTLVEELVAFCGGFSEEAERLLIGGPMMGMTLPHLRVPIVKGSNGILALTAAEARPALSRPCIRCARCVQACPLGLVPLEMAGHARAGDLDGAVEFGLQDCIACGTCAYVCPSAIPLTHYFNYAKGELAAQAEAKRKSDYTRRLAEARSERLRHQAEEKKAAAARRKAHQAAQQGEQRLPKETEPC